MRTTRRRATANRRRGAEIPLGAGMGHPGGGGVAASLREGGSLFPEEGPQLSLLVSSSSPSLENGVQGWGLVSPALSHCPVSRGGLFRCLCAASPPRVLGRGQGLPGEG